MLMERGIRCSLENGYRINTERAMDLNTTHMLTNVGQDTT